MDNVIRIGIDIDDTLNKFKDSVIDAFNKDYNMNISPDKMDSWNILNHIVDETNVPKDDLEQWFFTILDADGFFFNIEPVDDIKYVQDFYRVADKNTYDIYFVTSVHPFYSYAFNNKAKWIQKYFKENNPQMIYTKHKYVCDLDFLIDDSTKNCDEWLTRGNGDGLFLFYPQTYNEDFPNGFNTSKYPQDGWVRPSGWEEIVSIFLDK